MATPPPMKIENGSELILFTDFCSLFTVILKGGFMVKEAMTVAEVTLDAKKPTTLTFGELYTWVIWQFPRKKDGGLCGAVHPPTTSEGWFPAIIYNKDACVLVLAHLNESFTTPEAAAEYLNQNNGR